MLESGLKNIDEFVEIQKTYPHFFGSVWRETKKQNSHRIYKIPFYQQNSEKGEPFLRKVRNFSTFIAN